MLTPGIGERLTISFSRVDRAESFAYVHPTYVESMLSLVLLTELDRMRESPISSFLRHIIPSNHTYLLAYYQGSIEFSPPLKYHGFLRDAIPR